MDVEHEPGLDRQAPSALDRARVLSQALADAARLARVSKRSRRSLVGGGFQARRGARVLRLAVVLSFVVMVALPSLSSVIYYMFIAADEYVAEAKFTVAGGKPPTTDTIGSFTGYSGDRDHSGHADRRELHPQPCGTRKLEKTIDIRSLYATPQADPISRFNPSKPIEKFVRYWQHMTDVSISMPAGIVDLKVSAFTPEDATKITSAVLDISEALINEMNDRMNHDAVSNAELELDRSSARLTKALAALETRAQTTADCSMPRRSAMHCNKLINETRSSLLLLQQEYTSQLKYVTESAPQMRALKSRIDATSGQIAQLESKLTATKLTSSTEPTLATSMTKFAELDLERQVAERLYAGAASSLEIARLVAENKMMYLNTFVKPVLPEEPRYPRRLLFSAAIFAGSLAIWGACCGLAMAVRNYKA